MDKSKDRVERLEKRKINIEYNLLFGGQSISKSKKKLKIILKNTEDDLMYYNRRIQSETEE